VPNHSGDTSVTFKSASRIASIGVSEILQIGARAAEMKRAGRDVIVLGVGEPDFETPDNIKEAATRAMARGETKYTHLDGSPAMKDAVRHKFRTENGLDFAQEEISVSAGGKQVLFNAFMATVEPGDEVILPAPYWTSYIDIIKICGATPVVVECEADNGFRATAEQIEAAITPRTRWLLLNSPSNPSGAAYSRIDYRPILDVLMAHPHVWLMADDIYEHIVYDDFAFVTPLALEPELRDRTLTINGVSKAYAMTGWRIGYGAGPVPLIKVMSIIQSQSTSNPSSISQAAAIEALTGPQDYIATRCESFRERRDLVVSGLNAIEGITCRKSEGAFYAFPGCAGLFGRRTPDGAEISTSVDLANYLLEDCGVAVIPGSAFGAGLFFRISYATSAAELTNAIERIERSCRRLRIASVTKQRAKKPVGQSALVQGREAV
jgi:aspartate aminotransferase